MDEFRAVCRLVSTLKSWSDSLAATTDRTPTTGNTSEDKNKRTSSKRRERAKNPKNI